VLNEEKYYKICARLEHYPGKSLNSKTDLDLKFQAHYFSKGTST
jgi:hypothetical protein